MRGESPIQLIRSHYLDTFKDYLTRWERNSVTDINCALEHLGSTRLSNSNGKTFKILRSIDRMIDNLKYPNGPELDRESAITATYRYIFASPYDNRFASLTPGELCYRLKQAGVTEMDLQVQRYEDILSGQPTATLRMASISNGKAFGLRPKQPFTLTAAPDGTFPLQLHQPPQKSTPLQERKYSMPKQNTSVPPAEKTVTASEKAAKTTRKKVGRKPKIRQ